jgi:hypothetical protein
MDSGSQFNIVSQKLAKSSKGRSNRTNFALIISALLLQGKSGTKPDDYLLKMILNQLRKNDVVK